MKTDPDHKPGGMGEDLPLSPKETPRTQPASTKGAEMQRVFQLKKILVPVDFSKCSIKALQYAIPFARQFGAELTLLHVIQPAVVLQSSEMMLPGVPESTEDALQSLEELRKSIREDIASKSLVRTGSPHIEILDAAKELDIDLVVLSTHGRTGLSHILLGNTVEKVVRRAGCPVLVVREHEHEFINVVEFTT